MKKVGFTLLILLVFGGVFYYSGGKDSESTDGITESVRLSETKTNTKNVDSIDIVDSVAVVSPCSFIFEPTQDEGPYYTGKLLDAHLHLPSASIAVSKVSTQLGLPTPAWNNTLTVDYFRCLLQQEATDSVYGFHLLTKYSVTSEVDKAKAIEKKYPGMVKHFVMPSFISDAIDPDIASVREALEDNPGLFVGMGELKMYDGKSPDDPQVLAFLDLAREFKLLVMMHPFNHHKGAVEKIVKDYSDVTFLLHSVGYDDSRGENRTYNNLDWLDTLITNNANVYYSIDGGLPFSGWLKEHDTIAVPKEVSLPHAKLVFTDILNREVGLYKALIEKHPDRFLRGTDRWYGPHFDSEVSALMDEFSRAFIGRLDAGVQERFAYLNAKKLLK